MPDDKVIPVRVALRVRPLITKEVSEGCRTCLSFVPGEPQLIIGTDKCFTYDYIFNPDSPQEDVYERSVKQLVKSIFKGYNATVLAYGQTGSGKTHTMGGGYGVGISQEDHLVGVIPRVIEDLFNGMAEHNDFTFDVKVSYLEIYKEDILDLLVPHSQRDKDAVAVREDVNGGIRLTGLREVDVASPEETLDCLVRGSQGRTTGATAMNSQSSRSHAIFTLHITRTNKNDSQDLCCAKFHLVDLAGSERAKKTGAEGDRFREGININRGLLALGNVISALGSDKNRSHIPYRDSKLTRLLQDSLGGNSHTVMVACVSPADSNMEETLSTLRYADRARKIKNKPVVNRDPQAAEIARLRGLVQQLQTQLLQNGGTISGGNKRGSGTCSANSSLIHSESSEELQRLKGRLKDLEAENKKLSQELQEALDQCTTMHEKVILSEFAQDNLREQLTKLREKTDQTMSILNATFNKTLHEEGGQSGENEDCNMSLAPEHFQAIKEIQTTILQLEKDTQTAVLGLDTQTSPDKDNGTASPSGATASDPSMTEAGERAHILRQAAMNRELQQLTEILAKKQELATQMAGSENHMNAVDTQHKKEIEELESNIDKLQREKDDLMDALQHAKAGAASSKVSEQRRRRLQELEAQLATMRKKVTEQAKVVRLKEQTDKQVTKLNTEIKSMKHVRVKLMKQMKEDAEAWRKWRQQKDREVLQLKAQDRRRQAEIIRIQSKHQREQNVLKRKAEQAVAVNKRLKDALARQAAVAEERARQQEQHDLSKRGERMKKWLQQEIDVLVSAEEARQTLDALINDRKGINLQRVKLQDQLEFGPPKKRQLLSNSRTSIPNEEELRKQLREMDNEIELRNTQIQDLQQKLVDVNQDEKVRSRWNCLHSLVEAKSTLRHLLDAAVAAKVAASQREAELTEIRGMSDDLNKALESNDEEVKQLKNAHDRELLTLRQEYENKVLYLLGQLNQGNNKPEKHNESDDKLQRRLHFQEQEIARLAETHEELEKKRLECEALRKELTLSKYTGRASLMPEFDTPRDRLFTPVVSRKSRKRKSYVLGDESEEEDWSQELEVPTVENTSSNYDPDWHSGRTPGYSISYLEKRPTRQNDSRNTTASPASLDLTKNLEMASRSCKCNTKCSTRRCLCMKGGVQCSDMCKCKHTMCQNRVPEVPQSTTGDDDSESTNPSQLNSTFNVAQLDTPSEASQVDDDTVTSTSSKEETKTKSKQSRFTRTIQTRKSREAKMDMPNESFFPPPTPDDSSDFSKENSDLTNSSSSLFPPPSANDSSDDFTVPKGRPKRKHTLMSRSRSSSRTYLGKLPVP